ncbi:hypothetical protein ONZ45_g17235 [Pleurotus djamor]|nr:hypothetical protein ONZ45_g17235 [Pleurotus djamor]
MQQEPGDDYIRRLTNFVRTNEKALAEAGFVRRRRSVQRPTSADASAGSYLNPLGWFAASAPAATPPPKPVILSIDTHRLFYILMRLEAIGLDIGTLDVEVENPSRPTSYINVLPTSDVSDTMSLASFRSSLSAMSSLSLGGGWWGRTEVPSIDSELKYLFSSFTKLPALCVNAPGNKLIQELANEPPNRNAIPMDSFRNLQSLECVDIDPRILLGWDRMAESLRSLKIRKSGVEDMTDVFVGAVIDDQARRQGSASRQRRRRIPRGLNKEPSLYTTRLPDSVPEDEDGELAHLDTDEVPPSSSPPPSVKLSSLKWAFLKHLSVADNALTYFPFESIPYLTSLTHLDLSSNLFVSVPSGLDSLYNLVFLDLSDNMIDSVLGIYATLGQVLRINLSKNRLESICGLERLHALEHVDLRHNLIDDTDEISRLATLPNIADVCIEGNPFVEIDENYRVKCFDYFWKEGKTILLDGTPPGFYEKRHLTSLPAAQMTSSRSAPASAPPVVSVPHSHEHEVPSSDAKQSSSKSTPSTSKHASPHLAPVSAVGVHGRSRKKKVKRIVDLDGDGSDAAASSRSPSHSRMRSELSVKYGTGVRLREHGAQPNVKDLLQAPSSARDIPSSPASSKGAELRSTLSTSPAQAPLSASPEAEPISPPRKEPTLPTRSNGLGRPRHSRYQTEYVPHSFDMNDASNDTPRTMDTLDVSTSMSPPSFRRNPVPSATMASRSSLRRARVSASVYEPGPIHPTQTEEQNAEQIRYDADAYRKRIEALKKDMGDAWLKVYSQRI